jgi:hypothetical protein
MDGREQEIESRAWPPFAAELLREVVARQRRELDEHLSRIAEACGVTPEDGWRPDLERGRFVRPEPKSATV